MMKNSEKKERSQSAGSQIIQVHFFEPIDGKVDYFFGSLKAVYAAFTEDQIGCSIARVYASRLGERAKVTDKCRITRELVTRFPQSKEPKA